jgi:hypothetical protein
VGPPRWRWHGEVEEGEVSSEVRHQGRADSSLDRKHSI